MKKFFAYLFNWPLAYTQDMDGDIRLRKIIKTPFNEYTVKGVSSVTCGTLSSNNIVKNGSYIKKWIPANNRGECIAMLLTLEHAHQGSNYDDRTKKAN